MDTTSFNGGVHVNDSSLGSCFEEVKDQKHDDEVGCYSLGVECPSDQKDNLKVDVLAWLEEKPGGATWLVPPPVSPLSNCLPPPHTPRRITAPILFPRFPFGGGAPKTTRGRTDGPPACAFGIALQQRPAASSQYIPSRGAPARKVGSHHRP